MTGSMAAGQRGGMQAPAAATAAATPDRWLLPLFVVALIPPSYFFVGDMKLSPVRLLLLVAFLPLLVRLLSGAAGRLRPIDILLMLFMLWIGVTFAVHHGTERLPLAAITVVELFGGYLVGRTLVRNPDDHRLLYRSLFWSLVVMAPFVAYELLTDRNLLQEISRQVMPTYFKGKSSYGRMGMYRVMAGFEHPILYGLFAMTLFAPILALQRQVGFGTLLLAGFLGFMTFAALSSAPLLGLAVQIGLIAWAWTTGGRWWLLAGLVTVAYVTVDLLSNRTPITILISYITFDPATAWARINTWTFGSAEMWRHPVFGIGMNDWTRPSWLTGSVDNFWLLNGMRHGVVGVLLLIAALATGFFAVAQARGLDPEAARWRRAHVLTLVALYFTLCTVHVWASTSSYVMLLIGAGLWFADRPAPRAAAADPGEAASNGAGGAPAAGGLRYSRFPRHDRGRAADTLQGDGRAGSTDSPYSRHRREPIGG